MRIQNGVKEREFSSRKLKMKMMTMLGLDQGGNCALLWIMRGSFFVVGVFAFPSIWNGNNEPEPWQECQD